MPQNTYDTIIVGGGIAGLTAAAYLSRAGQRILVIEKNKEFGGLVNSFCHNGFRFDAGVRALEDAGIIFPMLKDLNISLKVVKSPVSIGIENDIINVETKDDLLKYGDLLKKHYPESGGEVDAVLKIIKRTMKQMDILYGIENPVFKDLKKDRSYLFKKLLPWLPKFIFTVRKINQLNVPIEEYLGKIIKNPSLMDIIAQHFFKNTPAFFALSYFSLYLDYFYPVGGVGKLAEALKNKIEDFRGNLLPAIKIIKVLLDNKIVVDQDGRGYRYDNLIWAADLKTFYRISRTDDLSGNVKKKFTEMKNKVLANRGNDSVFTLFLEVAEPVESFGKIAHGHFFFTPSRKGLGQTHRAELRRLLDDFEKTDKEDIRQWLNRFTGFNTYEISIPALKDPGLVEPGKTGIIVSLLMEYDLFKKIRETGWLDEFIGEVEDRILNVLSRSVYPMLKDKITARFSHTPLNIENRVGSSEGAIVGWAFSESIPVVHKIQYSDRSVATPIPSVYQAGQWAYSPAGVPMSILTGKLAADKILKK